MAVPTDTIVALSTPPGRSGIGVIRISGEHSLGILRTLLSAESYNPTPNVLSLQSVVDPISGDILDEALVCFFKAPHSFTGEDVVELHCHGSPVLLRVVIDLILQLSARLADPGEFTLRAVTNGRLRLTEAEAIRDLIDAQTDAALRQATRQLKGELSNRLRPAKEKLLEIIVRLESSLEFVEDDLPALASQEIREFLQNLQQDLSRLRSTFSTGRLLRNGLRVALVGRPNVGKSSLFNSLVGHGRAIVTGIAGTTRDTLTEAIGIDGVPVILIDTAGIRSSNDEIESIGVERARQEAADADLLIVVIDGSEPLHDEDRSVIDEVSDVRHVVALNKSDLPTFSSITFNGQGMGSNCSAVVSVSAKSEAGLATLRAAILSPFANGSARSEGVLITNARHHDLLVRSIEVIASSEQLLGEHASEEIVLVGLHNALRYLGEITGETTTEEILGQIFSTFCIGK
ncbi:MAG: tRNA modification GTPase, partial [Blastocatellia bacterium]|nr:tRNA modification GTPase [Blastocatellia bacterium]